MIALEVVFWVALGALVWTHAAYPLAAAAPPRASGAGRCAGATRRRP